ncbi:MAG: hypothetical protein V9G22_14870 [Ottowia sp.]
MDSNIFISFSHKDKPYRDELVPALEAVATIRDRVWFDQKFVDIGDRFHPEIQRRWPNRRSASCWSAAIS